MGVRLFEALHQTRPGRDQQIQTLRRGTLTGWDYITYTQGQNLLPPADDGRTEKTYQLLIFSVYETVFCIFRINNIFLSYLFYI